MQDYMKRLREGSRRKILRLIDKKLISWWREKEGFFYKEDHTPVEGLKFKNNVNNMSLTGGVDFEDDDIDDLDDSDDLEGLEDIKEGLENIE